MRGSYSRRADVCQVAFEKSTSKDQDCRYHWLALATLMTVVPIFVVGEWSKCTRVPPCVLLEPGRMSWFTPRCMEAVRRVEALPELSNNDATAGQRGCRPPSRR